MASVSWIQAKFSYGEISEISRAKPDHDFYYESLNRARNVIILPQSLPTKRYGLKYLDIINDAQDYRQIKIYNFSLGALSNYTVVFSPLAIRLFYKDFMCKSVPNPYSSSQLLQIKFAQQNGNLVIFHPDVPTKSLIRIASGPETITGMTENNELECNSVPAQIGQILPAKFSTEDKLPVTVPDINAINIYFIRATSTTTFKIYLNPDDAVRDEDALLIQSSGVDASLIVQNDWVFSDYNYGTLPTFDFNNDYSDIEFTFNSNVDPPTITSSSPHFEDRHIGGLIYFPSNTFRIIDRNSSNSVDVQVLDGTIHYADDEDPVFTGVDVLITTPAFTEENGYPSCGVFFESRFCVANIPSVNNYMALSVTSNANDFNDVGLFDTDGISYTVNADNGAYILNMIASKTLVVMTSHGIYSTPYSSTQPLSPGNMTVKQETIEKIADVPPVWLDNALIYVSGSGREIKSMKFDITISSYNLAGISDASSALIRNPIALATIVNNKTTPGNLLQVINNDGTCACYSSMEKQNVNGWSLFETPNGLFRNANGGDGECYFIIERMIDGENRFYLERSDFSHQLDSSVKLSFDTPTNTIPNLYHLSGLTVWVIADNWRLGEFEVVDGVLTLPDSYSEFEIGLFFPPLIETLPFNYPDSGTMFYYNGLMGVDTFIDYYESFSLTVDGDVIPMTDISDDDINSAPLPRTGVYKYVVRTNPQEHITVTISQNQPYPFTIRALGYERKK